MKYTFLCAVLLSSCGFSDPRTPSLSEDSKLHILLRAQQTANWAPWCEDYPSKENCSDGDAMAHGIGYLAALILNRQRRLSLNQSKTAEYTAHHIGMTLRTLSLVTKC
jgi:hypothetical protein